MKKVYKIRIAEFEALDDKEISILKKLEGKLTFQDFSINNINLEKKIVIDKEIDKKLADKIMNLINTKINNKNQNDKSKTKANL